VTTRAFDDRLAVTDTYQDEPDLYELLNGSRRKATFQWPPDWLTPTIAQGWLGRKPATHKPGDDQAVQFSSQGRRWPVGFGTALKFHDLRLPETKCPIS